MKLALLAAGAMALTLGATTVHAKDIPDGGLTIDEVAAWLTDNGYQAKFDTDDDGTKYIRSSAEGSGFNIHMYDCKEGRCASIEFSTGFDTKGAWSPDKINPWNLKNRWGRAYVDKVNDPWVEYDVDLSPGGTYEMLNDQFGIWRQALSSFKTFIGW